MGEHARTLDVPAATLRRREIGNRLLAALPVDDYERIAPAFETISLKPRTVLYRPGEPIDHVYFPSRGFCSMLTVLEDGNMVEIATIGHEGMIGASGFSTGLSTTTAMVQGEIDSCARMSAEHLRRETDRHGALYRLLMRYQEALFSYVAQSTACNAIHSVEQRLARWLLMARDHMKNDEFPLTQELAATMLGVARPTVTLIAGTLQMAGLITYHRGRVRIVDVAKLRTASCECYATTARLLANVTERSDRR